MSKKISKIKYNIDYKNISYPEKKSHTLKTDLQTYNLKNFFKKKDTISNI